MRPIRDTMTDLSAFIDLLVDIGCLTDDEMERIEKIETELYNYIKIKEE